jgi:O-6-methylguanine DNA methyltransferase
MQESQLEQLEDRWKEIYQNCLPAAAVSRSLAQTKWPVHNDHCFARIILDSVVGVNSPWTSKIKGPAYKNMSKEQLEASIVLGRQILDGDANLVELNAKSLELRGKKGNLTSVEREEHPKQNGTQKRGGDEISDMEERSQKEMEVSLTLTGRGPKETLGSESSSGNDDRDDLTPYLQKIALCHKTVFQKRVLTTLCQVPPGKYTTYAAISKHLSSSPRAVGNALKNNPFAPMVPCHRVLASDGSIGGFQGSWGRKGEEGKNDGKKRDLLRREGVRFDGRGRVVGRPWVGFR